MVPPRIPTQAVEKPTALAMTPPICAPSPLVSFMGSLLCRNFRALPRALVLRARAFPHAFRALPALPSGLFLAVVSGISVVSRKGLSWEPVVWYLYLWCIWQVRRLLREGSPGAGDLRGMVDRAESARAVSTRFPRASFPLRNGSQRPHAKGLSDTKGCP